MLLQNLHLLSHDIIHEGLELTGHFLDLALVLGLPSTELLEGLLPLVVLGALEELAVRLGGL